VFGKGVHINPIENKYLASSVLPHDGANIEMDSDPKKALRVDHT
jgi:hypothetical protein